MTPGRFVTVRRAQLDTVYRFTHERIQEARPYVQIEFTATLVDKLHDTFRPPHMKLVFDNGVTIRVEADWLMEIVE